jgi:hypothetical protein
LLFYDAGSGQLTFTRLSTVRRHTLFFKWGEAAVNAHRYCRAGKDFER